MYEEYELLISYSPEEAWELYDTVYRNFGWIHTDLGNYEKALDYFQKAVEVKRKNGVPAHWFDQWDLGKAHARISLIKGHTKGLILALDLIKEAMDLHQQVEPQDKIMLCKMLNSAGEIASVLGDYADFSGSAVHYEEAVQLHRKSYELYMVVLGPGKPLTGWCMENLAGALRKVDSVRSKEEAKQMLLGALAVECSKDIIKLPSMALLHDVLAVHQETSDLEGLAKCQEVVNEGLSNLQKRGIDHTECTSYAALLRSVASLLLAHSAESNRDCAIELLKEGVVYLRRALSGDEVFIGHDTNQRYESDPDLFLNVPRAGGQKMENVDARDLLLQLEAQLAQLQAAPVPVASSNHNIDFEVVEDGIEYDVID